MQYDVEKVRKTLQKADSTGDAVTYLASTLYITPAQARARVTEYRQLLRADAEERKRGYAVEEERRRLEEAAKAAAEQEARSRKSLNHLSTKQALTFWLTVLEQEDPLTFLLNSGREDPLGAFNAYFKNHRDLIQWHKANYDRVKTILKKSMGKMAKNVAETEAFYTTVLYSENPLQLMAEDGVTDPRRRLIAYANRHKDWK